MKASHGKVRALKVTHVQHTMHPPGAPTITGYTTGHVVQAGRSIRLVCLSWGGNPLAQVFWYKNDEVLDFSYVSGNDRSENELVFILQPNDNEAVYSCEASNPVTEIPLRTQVILSVHFGPDGVSIQGQPNAKTGETIPLRCTTAISNPRALITWFSEGRELEEATYIQTVAKEGGGYVSTSEISVTPGDNRETVVYECLANNTALGKSVVDAILIKVIYPPENLTISGYTEGLAMKAGTMASLTCTAVGGSPPAILTWWKGDSEIEGNPTRSGNLGSNQIFFILKPEDNEADYRCNASNAATLSPLLESIRRSVNFPPKKLDISTIPLKARVGEKLVITCKSGSSNPPSDLTWLKDGDEITGIDGGQVDSDYGGKSTISRLEVTPTEQDYGETYECRAANEFLHEAIIADVKLDVLYKPMFPSDIPSEVNVVEFTSTVLNMTALANPANIVYYWTKNGQYIRDGPVLYINHVTRADAGEYVVEANNDEGGTQFSFEINVQYAAEIRFVSKNVLVDESSSAVLECIVLGNPMLENMVTWSRAGYAMSKTSVEYSDGRSLLHVANVTKEDSGLFVCTANNNIGQPTSANAELLVKYAPEIDESPAFGTVAAIEGSTAMLKCKAQGVPDVSFAWFKGDTQLDMSGRKYYEMTLRSDLVYYESHLLVFNIASHDYGEYTCVASNVLGQDFMIITVDHTSSPDPPYDIQFINATHNTITLSWKPGFDGGTPQTFRLRVNEMGELGTTAEYSKYDDVSEGIAIHTVEGLKLGTEYEITVMAKNNRGESPYQRKGIRVRTSAVAPIMDDK